MDVACLVAHTPVRHVMCHALLGTLEACAETERAVQVRRTDDILFTVLVQDVFFVSSHWSSTIRSGASFATPGILLY